MAAPTMLEQSRIHSVVGAFGANGSAGGGITTGGVITTLTNATPSVFTATTAHGLIVGDYIQVAGVTTDTSVNGNVQVSAISGLTFSIATAGIGTAGGLSASSASFAYPISSVTGDWTIRLRLESLTAHKNIEIALEDSVDGITWLTRFAKNVTGAFSTGAMVDLISLRKYDYPSFRFGTASAVMRVNVIAIDAAATAVLTAWFES